MSYGWFDPTLSPVTWFDVAQAKEGWFDPLFLISGIEAKYVASAVGSDYRVVLTRASIGTYWGADGLLHTAPANEPRIDYDPLSGECLGLHIEESRTNLFLWSEDQTIGVWSKSLVTVPASVYAAPTGGSAAFLLLAGTSLGAHYVYQSIPCSAYTTYTLSIFARKATGPVKFLTLLFPSSAFGANILATFDLAAGTYTTANSPVAASIEEFGEWYRCSVTATASATGSMSLQIRISNAATDTLANFTGDGVNGIDIFGAQCEVGSFPSSYLLTEGATVTREADVLRATGTGFSSWYNTAGGTLLVDFLTGRSLSSTRVVTFHAGNPSNDSARVRINSGGQLDAAVLNAGGVESAAPLGPVSALSRYLVASAFATNNFAAACNGGPLATETLGNLATFNALDIGGLGGSEYLNGHIAKFAYYNSRLSDANVQSLSSGKTVTASPSFILDFAAVRSDAGATVSMPAAISNAATANASHAATQVSYGVHTGAATGGATASAVMVFPGAVTEVATSGSVQSAIVTIPATKFEALDAGSTHAVIASFPKAVTEAGAADADADTQMDMPAAVVEAGTGAASAVNTLVTQKTQTEAASAADSGASAMSRQGAVTETSTADLQSIAELVQNSSASELAAAASSHAGQGAYVDQVTEVSTGTATQAAGLLLTGVSSESASAQDQLTLQRISTGAVVEAGVALGIASTGSSGSVNSVESAVAGASAMASSFALVEMQAQAIATETAAVYVIRAASLQESVTAIDAATGIAVLTLAHPEVGSSATAAGATRIQNAGSTEAGSAAATHTAGRFLEGEQDASSNAQDSFSVDNSLNEGVSEYGSATDFFTDFTVLTAYGFFAGEALDSLDNTVTFTDGVGESLSAMDISDAATLIFLSLEGIALAEDVVNGLRIVDASRIEKIASAAGVRLDISTGRMVKDLNSKLVMSL